MEETRPKVASTSVSNSIGATHDAPASNERKVFAIRPIESVEICKDRLTLPLLEMILMWLMFLR
jgi:hypothetical protein